MKKIKLVILLVLIVMLCFIAYLYFFLPIPNFYSTNLKKEIKQNRTVIIWTSVTGILDQNFPDYIIIRKDNLIDTICKSHNIADLQMKNDTIIIGFHGTPKIYNRYIIIPDEIYNYKIKINTDF
jgi:hypothetical protein